MKTWKGISWISHENISWYFINIAKDLSFKTCSHYAYNSWLTLRPFFFHPLWSSISKDVFHSTNMKQQVSMQGSLRGVWLTSQPKITNLGISPCLTRAIAWLLLHVGANVNPEGLDTRPENTQSWNTTTAHRPFTYGPPPTSQSRESFGETLENFITRQVGLNISSTWWHKEYTNHVG